MILHIKVTKSYSGTANTIRGGTNVIHHLSSQSQVLIKHKLS